MKAIKVKKKERKGLLVERDATPVYNLPKRHELSGRITTLTEDLEELNSEKALLLQEFDKSDDAGYTALKHLRYGRQMVLRK